MKRIVYVFLALSLLVIFVPAMASAEEAYVCPGYSVELIAGGGNPNSAEVAGHVCVTSSDGYLYLFLTGSAPWYIYEGETHVHVFNDSINFTDVPLKNGNPIPGQFDYANRYWYKIPLDDDLGPGDTIYIAVHAVMTICTVRFETAWAADGYPDSSLQFPGKNWAMYFAYTLP